MKKLHMTGIIILLTALSFLNAQAAESLGDWKDYIWQGNITMSHPGTVFSVSANGANKEAMGTIYKNFPNAVGMFATVTVSSSSGENGIGIRQNIGKAADGNKIMAEVYVNQYPESNQGNKRLQYKIRKRDSNGNTLKVYARGYLGDFFDGWSLGESVQIAFARVGDEVWFYTPKNNVGLVKILFMEPVTAIADQEMEIWAWTQEGTGHSVSGTVRDVGILYPWW